MHLSFSKRLKKCLVFEKFNHVCTDIDIVFREPLCFAIFGSLKMGRRIGKTITTNPTSCLPNDIDFMFCLDAKFRSLKAYPFDIMYRMAHLRPKKNCIDEVCLIHGKQKQKTNRKHLV